MTQKRCLFRVTYNVVTRKRGRAILRDTESPTVVCIHLPPSQDVHRTHDRQDSHDCICPLIRMQSWRHAREDVTLQRIYDVRRDNTVQWRRRRQAKWRHQGDVTKVTSSMYTSTHAVGRAAITPYTRFYGSFATNSEVCFVQDFLQVKFRTVGYYQNMLFPSQTDTFWSWKQVEIKNRDAEQESAKRILVGRGGGAANSQFRPPF